MAAAEVEQSCSRVSASGLTWASWIPLFRPHLSPVLAGETALDWLQDLARQVPEDCLGAIELRLADGAPAVDFSIRLARPDQARAMAPSLASVPARCFLTAWARREAALQPVSSLWLEFDSAPGAPDLPTPLLCVRVDGPCEPGWLVGTLLPAMQGAPLGAAQRRVLERCLTAVPPEAQVLYAFSLLGRSEGGVRLELYGLDPSAMASYLRSVVSTAAAEQVESVAHLAAGADRFHLSFDVGEEISPRIGVEYGLRRQPRREPRWAELLDRLVTHGLASPAKRDALLAWPGQDSLWTAPDRWPAAVVGLGGHGVRCLSHLKLVLHPGQAPEAKAYLLFQHLPGRVNPTRRSQ